MEKIIRILYLIFWPLRIRRLSLNFLNIYWTWSTSRMIIKRQRPINIWNLQYDYEGLTFEVTVRRKIFLNCERKKHLPLGQWISSRRCLGNGKIKGLDARIVETSIPVDRFGSLLRLSSAVNLENILVKMKTRIFHRPFRVAVHRWNPFIWKTLNRMHRSQRTLHRKINSYLNWNIQSVTTNTRTIHFALVLTWYYFSTKRNNNLNLYFFSNNILKLWGLKFGLPTVNLCYCKIKQGTVSVSTRTELVIISSLY